MTTPETSRDMTPERMNAILAAYGAAPSRWPEADREAAEALIARSEPARAALAEAAHLDRLLDAAPAVPEADGLAARLRAMMPERAAEVVPFVPRPTRAPRPRPWHATGFARAAVVALAVVGGVGIGLALPEIGGPLTPVGGLASTDLNAPEPSLAALDTADIGDTGGPGDAGGFAATATGSGTPLLASLMQSGEPGFTTVSYVEDSSDDEGLALAALPLQ